MKEFKIIKKFPLTFLGEGWKDAYINFRAITIGDIKNEFPKFRTIDEKDEDATIEGVADVLEFLKSKFISGKGNVDGSLVDLEAEDLMELSAEVMSRALSFLSQGVAPDSPKK